MFCLDRPWSNSTYPALTHCGHHWDRCWVCTWCPGWLHCALSNQNHHSCPGWTCKWAPPQSCSGTLLMSDRAEAGSYIHIITKEGEMTHCLEASVHYYIVSSVTPTVYLWVSQQCVCVCVSGGVYNSLVLITPCNLANRISKLRCDLSLTVAEASLYVCSFLYFPDKQFGSVCRSCPHKETWQGCVCFKQPTTGAQWTTSNT